MATAEHKSVDALVRGRTAWGDDVEIYVSKEALEELVMPFLEELKTEIDFLRFRIDKARLK